MHTKLFASKAVLIACLCTREIMPVNKQTWPLLEIWYGGRKCTKLALKLLADKKVSPFQFCVLLLSCIFYYFSLHDEYPPLLYTTRSIYIVTLPFLINWNEKPCSESNILTMDHEPVLENSSSAPFNTLPYTNIYLKAIKYFHNQTATDLLN